MSPVTLSVQSGGKSNGNLTWLGQYIIRPLALQLGMLELGVENYQDLKKEEFLENPPKMPGMKGQSKKPKVIFFITFQSSVLSPLLNNIEIKQLFMTFPDRKELGDTRLPCDLGNS